jgi:hypothetical protein
MNHFGGSQTMNDLTDLERESLREALPTGEEAPLLALLSAQGVDLAKLAACWHAFGETGRAGSLTL